MFRLLVSFLSLIVVVVTSPAARLNAADTAITSFESRIAPILIKRCLECHGEIEPSGKLTLTTRASALRGGESGPALAPRDVATSLLLARVVAGEMPPPKRGHSQKLLDAEITALRDWIASGAEWPEARKLDLFESTNEVRAGRDWWSLQPVKRPFVPLPPSSGERARVRGPNVEKTSTDKQEGRKTDLQQPKASSTLSPPHPNPLPPKAGGEGTRVANPVDAFIVSQLHANDMEPAPPADRRTLIKRVSFDLLGLPPTFDEIEAFVSDQAPDAYERLVDRLLASPHFGERWARHWLDLVRYADTSGYERDQEKPGAWKYRDWVVRAINDDLPYSRFIIEQLAGDELPDRNEQSLIATGFLRLGTWNDEPNDAEEYKYDRLEDLVGTTSTAFLGYTIKCARCHDHKFDPIQQADYYRMAAAFWPGAVEQRGRELLGGPSVEELQAALGSPPSAVAPSNKPITPDILAWTDIRPAPPIHLLRKGEPKQPREVIEPAAMSFLAPLSSRLGGERARVRGADERTASSNKKDSILSTNRDDKDQSRSPLTLTLSPQCSLLKTGGGEGTKSKPPLASLRRTQLAHWIAHPDNPLTWRVIVNRLWTHHFGNGLVRSPDNFGFTGDKPTHPELLDWLAAEATSPESLKRLHRQLVTSATYRQASLHPKQDEYLARDAANHLWWHAERRRLDAESLRDRMLFVGDSLDTRLTGPGFKPTIQAEALEGLSRKGDAWQPSPPHEQLRRSLYSFSARSLLPPMMTTFDFGDTTLPCGQRPVSTVAPQALALLNNAFSHERSAALAARILSTLESSSGPLAPRLGGERARVKGANERPTSSSTNDSTLPPNRADNAQSRSPLTLTLSPEDGGEGARVGIDERVRLAWRQALARDPTQTEAAAARDHFDQQRLRWPDNNSRPLASLCHVLLNTNEFAYVD